MSIILMDVVVVFHHRHCQPAGGGVISRGSFVEGEARSPLSRRPRGRPLPFRYKNQRQIKKLLLKRRTAEVW
jgi:hypothetical protein